MSGLELWFIRHGETEINAGVWSANPAKTHLTLNGLKQAEQAATQVVEQPDLFIVSPLIRAKETMRLFTSLWPKAPLSILPIQEFIYLSPSRLALLGPVERKEQIKEYWRKNDPYYCDGDDSESFAAFLQRVSTFYQYLTQQRGYVVVVGHGQFIKAFQLGIHHGFKINSTWMHLFREKETTEPIKNCEVFSYTLP